MHKELRKLKKFDNIKNMQNNSGKIEQEQRAFTKCLVCEKPAESGKRGLCTNHYMQFRRAMQSLPIEKQDEFEQLMIDQGKLLLPQKGGRATLNPFAEAAQQFLSPNDQKFLADTAKAVERAEKKRKPKK